MQGSNNKANTIRTAEKFVACKVFSLVSLCFVVNNFLPGPRTVTFPCSKCGKENFFNKNAHNFVANNLAKAQGGLEREG